MNYSLLFRIIFLPLIACIGTYMWFTTDGSILGYIFVFIFANICSWIGTAGFHRWISHRSFEPTLHGKYILMLCMLMESLGRPLLTAAVHRSHHIHSDSEGDPHSPKFLSFKDMMLGFYKQPPSLPPLRDILKQRDIMFFDRNYWLLWLLLNILIALVDWRVALLLCPLTFCKSWFGGQTVNYHGHGKQKCEPTNSSSKLVVFFSGGEHLHANHHEKPGNWRFDRQGGMIDITAYLITWLRLRKT